MDVPTDDLDIVGRHGCLDLVFSRSSLTPPKTRPPLPRVPLNRACAMKWWSEMSAYINERSTQEVGARIALPFVQIAVFVHVAPMVVSCLFWYVPLPNGELGGAIPR